MTKEEQLKENSPYALPDNPAQSGWSTAQIKEKFYAGLFLLLQWLEDLAETESGDKQNLNNAISALNSLLTSYANGTNPIPKAVGDENGDNISQTYVKNANVVHKTGNEDIDGIKRLLKVAIFSSGISDGDITLLINQLVSKGFLSEQLQEKASKTYVDQGLVNKESSVNKKTVINTPSNEYYPTVKAVIDFVNSSINALASYPIKKNAQGDNFATKAELLAATVFYSGGQVRVPTKLDYAIVDQDESRPVYTAGVIDIYREYTTTAEYVDYYVLVSGTYTKVTNANKDSLSIVPGITVPYTMSIPSTRYSYNNGWEFDHIVNTTPFTNAQEKALNSGIDSEGVQQIAQNKQDIATKLGIVEAEGIYQKKPEYYTVTIAPNEWTQGEDGYVATKHIQATFVDPCFALVAGLNSAETKKKTMYGVNLDVNNDGSIDCTAFELPTESISCKIFVQRGGTEQ